MLFRCLLAGLLFCGFGASAFDKNFTAPDYDKIEKLTKDKSSNFYYPTLLYRYTSNDTSLTTEEMHMLYYGLFFYDEKPTKTAYTDLHYQDSIRTINYQESLTDDDRRLLIKYYTAKQEQYFFDISAMISLFSLTKKLRDPISATYLYKIKMLVRVIQATGDGKTATSGFHVNAVSSEYDLLNIYGYKSKSQSLIGQCDYLELEPNEEKIEGIYFDVSQIFKGYQKMINPDTFKDILDKTEDKRKKK